MVGAGEEIPQVLLTPEQTAVQAAAVALVLLLIHLLAALELQVKVLLVALERMQETHQVVAVVALMVQDLMEFPLLAAMEAQAPLLRLQAHL